MPQFICSENHSNKFWQYDIINDTSVLVKWGRIAGTQDEKTHGFGNMRERDKFIAEKVREKTNPNKKGGAYKLVTEEVLEKETKSAAALGARYKVKRLEYVNKKGDKLRVLGNYDPEEHIYVEVLNSWSKDVERYLFLKDKTWKITGGVAEGSQTIEIDGLVAMIDELSQSVRAYLKVIAAKVIKIIAQKFAAVGIRALDLGLDDEESSGSGGSSVFDLFDAVSESGVSKQVVSKFASLGNRVLEL